VVAADVGVDVSPSGPEKGANPVPVARWQDAKALRSGPPEDAQEKGLGTILGVMPGGDPVSPGPR
jgi:hypothetical protein